MWLAYGTAQFPSGILADRYGEKPIILIAVGGTTVMSLLLALAPLYPLFVAFAVLLGGVAGLHYAVATTLLSRTFDELGMAVGVHSMGGPLAGLLAPFAAAWVGVRFGWRPAVALTVGIGVPVFVLFLWRVRPTEPRRPTQPMRERLKIRPLFHLLSQPTIAFPLVIAMAGTYVTQGLMSFLPVFLIEFRGYSPTVASIIFSIFFVVRAGGQILLGSISDAYGRDYAITGAMFAGGIGSGLFVFGPGLLAVICAVLLAGIGASFFSAIDPRFMDELSDKERGMGFGLVRTVYTVIGATGSFGVGLSADLFGWGIAFITLAALLTLAFTSLVLNNVLNLGY
jgi:MFS family permease